MPMEQLKKLSLKMESVLIEKAFRDLGSGLKGGVLLPGALNFV